MISKKIIYISDVNASESLFHSQVLPHVNELKKHYKVDLIVLTRGESYNYEFSYQSLQGDYSIFFSYLSYLKNKKNLYEFLNQTKYDMIYSRGFRGGLLGAFIKKYYFKNKIVLINDVRADVLDEHKECFIKRSIFKQSIKYVFLKANSLFFVSSFLKNKYCSMFNVDASTQIFPTFVPDNKFIFDEDIRLEYRRNLGYNKNDIVLLYSGNLAKWQNVDFILEAFENSNNTNLKLLFLTRDEKIYKKTANLKKLDFISIKKADYNEIQNYYYAADLGLLIRDNIDTNKSASPTKFSEYVNSGLALIINEIEADYVDDFIKNNMKGVLLKSKDELLMFFNQVELSSIERNTSRVNILSDIVHKQMTILNQ